MDLDNRLKHFNIKGRQIVIEIVFIMVITILLCKAYFHGAFQFRLDGFCHLYRLQGIVSAFQDGQFLPKIYPFINNGYGYAVPLFSCEILLYPFAFLYWLGVPLLISYKIMEYFYTFLSIIIVFYVAKRMSKKTYVPYIAVILYKFCNFNLYNIYLRDALGEKMVSCFIPLVFLSAYYIFVENKDKWLLLGITFSLLLFSHVLNFTISCVLFFIFFMAFFIKNLKRLERVKKALLTILKGAAFAILLTSLYLLPFLEQFLSQEFSISYLGNSYNIQNGSDPIGFLTMAFPHLENFRLNLGYVLYYLPLIYIYLFLKGKGNKIISFLFVINYVFVICSLGVIRFSGIFQFVNTMQFAFRFNVYIIPLSIIIIMYCLNGINIKAYYVCMLFILIYSLISFVIIDYENVGYFHTVYDYNSSIEDMVEDVTAGEDIDAWLIAEGMFLPATDSWSKQFYWEDADRIKVLHEDGVEYHEACKENNGDLIPVPYTKRGTHIEFEYTSINHDVIMLPLTYYKGYEVYALDDEENKIQVNLIDVPKYKQVAFDSLDGTYQYICHYKGTLIQKVSLVISSITFIYMICLIIRKKKYRVI